MIIMSDDFEIVDPSTLQLASRGRRSKGLGQGSNFIPANTWTNPFSDKSRRMEYQYYRSLQRIHQRRTGEMETPYDHLIDKELLREEEYNKLFPITLVEARMMAEELAKESVKESTDDSDDEYVEEYDDDDDMYFIFDEDED